MSPANDSAAARVEELIGRFRTACGMPESVRIALHHPQLDVPIEHVFDAPFCIAGSHPGCGLSLPSRIASDKHLFFQFVFGKLFCFDLSEPERGAADRKTLVSELGVRAGGFVVETFDSSSSSSTSEVGGRICSVPTPVHAPRPRYRFRMINRGHEHRRVPLATSVTTFGRGAQCRVRFSSRRISNVHAACVVAADGVWVVDLLSRTGVYVNEQRVELQRLRSGDGIRFGACEFQLQEKQPDAGASFSAESICPSSIPQKSCAKDEGAKKRYVLQASSVNLPAPTLLASAFTVAEVDAACNALSTGRESADAHRLLRVLEDLVRLQRDQAAVVAQLTELFMELRREQTDGRRPGATQNDLVPRIQIADLPTGSLPQEVPVTSVQRRASGPRPSGVPVNSMDSDMHERFQQRLESPEDDAGTAIQRLQNILAKLQRR